MKKQLFGCSLTFNVCRRFSDRIGRSIMLLLGLPNMAWSMLVFAFLFKISDTSVQVPLVSVWAVIFVLFYAPTGGTSPFVSRTDKADES